jgi:hypothetical protein
LHKSSCADKHPPIILIWHSFCRTRCWFIKSQSRQPTENQSDCFRVWKMHYQVKKSPL